jgi:hypothetical protein
VWGIACFSLVLALPLSALPCLLIFQPDLRLLSSPPERVPRIYSRPSAVDALAGGREHHSIGPWFYSVTNCSAHCGNTRAVFQRLPTLQIWIFCPSVTERCSVGNSMFLSCACHSAECTALSPDSATQSPPLIQPFRDGPADIFPAIRRGCFGCWQSAQLVRSMFR